MIRRYLAIRYGWSALVYLLRPIRWLYRPTAPAFVDPFPHWQPPQSAWDRYIAEGRKKYVDPPVFEPPSHCR